MARELELMAMKIRTASCELVYFIIPLYDLVSKIDIARNTTTTGKIENMDLPDMGISLTFWIKR